MLKVPSNVSLILNILSDNNYNAIVVGGCVRDSLLGREPKDWDIATNALPDDVVRIFKSKGYSVLEVGKTFGTVVVIIDDINYEVTTFRTETGYFDSRHPASVSYCNTFNEDALRRDFTINALAYNNDIIDVVGGFDDLNNKVIRCVGNAYDRFEEDSLRILRALRFAVKYDFKIERETECAMLAYAYKLCDGYEWSISRERVSSELLQIFKYAKNINEVIDRYYDIFSAIIPELNSIRYLSQNNKYHVGTVYQHTLLALGYYKGDDVAVKLSLLFHDLGKATTSVLGDDGFNHFYGHSSESEKITREICNRLKFTNELKSKVCTLVLNHDNELPLTEKSLRRLVVKLGNDNIQSFLDLKECDIYAHDVRLMVSAIESLNTTKKLYLNFNRKEQCLKITDMKFTGKDLIAMGYKPSRYFGIVLNTLFNMILDDGTENDYDKLKVIAKDLMESTTQ